MTLITLMSWWVARTTLIALITLITLITQISWWSSDSPDNPDNPDNPYDPASPDVLEVGADNPDNPDDYHSPTYDNPDKHTYAVITLYQYLGEYPTCCPRARACLDRTACGFKNVITVFKPYGELSAF